MGTEVLDDIVCRVMNELAGRKAGARDAGAGPTIPVAVSNRHLHLGADDLKTLFGPGHALTLVRRLVQPGEFAAAEKVTLVGPRGVLEHVTVVGPVRSQTQIEVSRTDAFRLGSKPPVMGSGSLAGSAGVVVVGPAGAVTLTEGLILAQRHIHMQPADARRFGVAHGRLVQVQTTGERALIFDQVLVRVSDNYRLEMHVDTDEANAALLNNGDRVTIVPAGGRTRA